MVSHFDRAVRRLGSRTAAKPAALVLAVVTSTALFADLLAADAPVMAVGHGRVRLLLAVTEASGHADASRDELDRRYADEIVVWPLVRQGPARREVASEAPSRRHPLGTDHLGRDVFAILVHGARAAVAPALVALLFSVLVGGLMGGLAGLLGGVWDELVARATEVASAFPFVVVAGLAVAVTPLRSASALALAIAATRWCEVARIVRIEALRLTGEPHGMAARAMGASHARIVTRHLLPATLGPVAVVSAATLPAVVLLDGASAYLGLGQPDSWGSVIAAAGGRPGSWLPTVLGLTAVLGTASAGKVLADALADALDPRGTSDRTSHRRTGDPGTP